MRRYQNPDGSLTDKGKKRYYGREETIGYTTKVNRLTDAGRKFNKDQSAKKDRMVEAVKGAMKAVKGKEFDKHYKDYTDAEIQSVDSYHSDRDKWFKQEGKYKGKDYYQFKDIAREDFSKTDAAKKQKQAYEEMKKLVVEAAKEHPLYEKSYKQLKDINIFDLKNEKIYIQDINYGEAVVKQIMSDIHSQSYEDAMISLGKTPYIGYKPGNRRI